VRVAAQNGALMFDGPGGPPVRLMAQGGGLFVTAADADTRLSFVPSAARAERVLVTVAGRVVFNGTRVP
jgi:hypothetical protein